MYRRYYNDKRAVNMHTALLAGLAGVGGAYTLVNAADKLYNKFLPTKEVPWYLTQGGTMALGAGLGAGMGAGAGMIYGPAVGAGLGGITGGVAGYYGNKLFKKAYDQNVSRRLVDPRYAMVGTALGSIAGTGLGALGPKAGLARMALGAGLGGLVGGGAAGYAGKDVHASYRGYSPYFDKKAGGGYYDSRLKFVGNRVLMGMPENTVNTQDEFIKRLENTPGGREFIDYELGASPVPTAMGRISRGTLGALAGGLIGGVGTFSAAQALGKSRYDSSRYATLGALIGAAGGGYAGAGPISDWAAKRGYRNDIAESMYMQSPEDFINSGNSKQENRNLSNLGARLFALWGNAPLPEGTGVYNTYGPGKQASYNGYNPYVDKLAITDRLILNAALNTAKTKGAGNVGVRLTNMLTNAAKQERQWAAQARKLTNTLPYRQKIKNQLALHADYAAGGASTLSPDRVRDLYNRLAVLRNGYSGFPQAEANAARLAERVKNLHSATKGFINPKAFRGDALASGRGYNPHVDKHAYGTWMGDTFIGRDSLASSRGYNPYVDKRAVSSDLILKAAKNVSRSQGDNIVLQRLYNMVGRADKVKSFPNGWSPRYNVVSDGYRKYIKSMGDRIKTMYPAREAIKGYPGWDFEHLNTGVIGRSNSLRLMTPKDVSNTVQSITDALNKNFYTYYPSGL